MTDDEARKIAQVIKGADGGCHVCYEALAEDLNELFPAWDWVRLVRLADGYTEDEIDAIQP
jgi:hypothetical protein